MRLGFRRSSASSSAFLGHCASRHRSIRPHISVSTGNIGGTSDQPLSPVSPQPVRQPRLAPYAITKLRALASHAHSRRGRVGLRFQVEPCLLPRLRHLLPPPSDACVEAVRATASAGRLRRGFARAAHDQHGVRDDGAEAPPLAGDGTGVFLFLRRAALPRGREPASNRSPFSMEIPGQICAEIRTRHSWCRFSAYPPLARGTLLTRLGSVGVGRLIPPRAGNTAGSIVTTGRPSAHPRSRGEHCYSLPIHQICPGSVDFRRELTQDFRRELTRV